MDPNPYESPLSPVSREANRMADGPARLGVVLLLANLVVCALPILALGLAVSPMLPAQVQQRLGPVLVSEEDPWWDAAGVAASICIAVIHLTVVKMRNPRWLQLLAYSYIGAGVLAPFIPELAHVLSLAFTPRFEWSLQLVFALCGGSLVVTGPSLLRYGARLSKSADVLPASAQDSVSACR